MLKLFRQAFKVTNDGIVLAIPLTLFWWLITLYINYSKTVVDTLPEVALSVVTMIFMTGAFLSGWFYMVKKCVEFSKKEFILDKDRKHEAFNLIKAMPAGVGKFFLHYVTVSMLFVAIALLIVYIVKILSYDSVQSIYTSLLNYGITPNSATEVNYSLNEVPQETLIKIFWEILIPSLKLTAIVFAIPAIFSFLLLLWMPEIIYTGRNPFAAIFTSIKKLFLNFGKSFKLYIYITIIQMFISFIGPFSLLNVFIYMLAMFTYFYFLVYVVILVFMYYDTISDKQNPEE